MNKLSHTAGTYYRLVKPGIVYGNLISAIAGFLFASCVTRSFPSMDFIVTVTGLGLIIAAGCVLNNIIDRPIDRLMTRTKSRALATGEMSVSSAVLYAMLLALLGAILLLVLPTPLALYAALLGLFFYVVVYGVAKRTTPHSTEIGAISGAIPPVVGYVAVMQQFDTLAVCLFLILVTWQMIHFYAIALFRQKEYESAGIRLFPTVYGVSATKIALYIYTFLFGVTTLLPTFFGATGVIYTLIVLSWSVYWLLTIYRTRSTDTSKWARIVFKNSLLSLLIVSAALSIGPLLP